MRHERRIIAAQEAPPNLVLLRNGHGGVLPVFPSRPPVSTAWANAGWKLSTTSLTGRGRECHKSMIIDGVATVGKPAAISVRKPTFLQKERWKVIQKARRRGMSFQAIGRKLGIHRGSSKKYLDAEGPQLDNPEWFPQRRHLMTSQHNRVTFTLNTYPDTFPDLRHPSGPIS